MTPTVFDSRVCALGEGPLWHPTRKRLFWFDILGHKLLASDGDATQEWEFDEHVSAAGWVDDDRLLIASETGLSCLNLETGESEWIRGLESDNNITRSNDGRADPMGGFWIGTMGKNIEKGAGAIYRYYDDELRRLYKGITISNAICFGPDGRTAYFTDTVNRKIMRQALDVEGWPDGSPELFIDLRAEELNPDGAVVDAQGCLWNAQWGASRVARYDPQGQFIAAVDFPATQISCPAFGGVNGTTLFATSAADGTQSSDLNAGLTFSIETDVAGQPEHRVIL